jgi:hypothetical protein
MLRILIVFGLSDWKRPINFHIPTNFPNALFFPYKWWFDVEMCILHLDELDLELFDTFRKTTFRTQNLTFWLFRSEMIMYLFGIIESKIGVR